MRKINIDEISVMPKKLRSVIHSLNTRTENNISMNTEGDFELDPLHLRFINDIEFIVGYGRGYWAGVDEEFTLIRLKDNCKYYWVYTDYSYVKVYAESKETVEKVLFSMSVEQQKRYFVEMLTKFKQESILRGDIELFCGEIWSEIAKVNKEIRNEFQREMLKVKKKIKEDHLQQAFNYFKTTQGLVKLEIESGKLVAEFPENIRFEIKEAE
ncbi:hypothetical protein [Priestia megaterium]|uniref:hypothetical protein n=1 Tax=Priestia megaterium TaxID=1404 RepID=UPI0031012FA9